jgi:hypothetical protein
MEAQKEQRADNKPPVELLSYEGAEKIYFDETKTRLVQLRIDGKMVWGEISGPSKYGRTIMDTLRNASLTSTVEAQAEPAAAITAPASQHEDEKENDDEPKKLTSPPAYAYLNNRWAKFVVEGQEYIRDEFLKSKLDEGAISEVRVPSFCKNCGKPWRLKTVYETLQPPEQKSPESRGLKQGLDYDIAFYDPDPLPIQRMTGVEVDRCCDNPETLYKSFLFNVEVKPSKVKQPKATRTPKKKTIPAQSAPAESTSETAQTTAQPAAALAANPAPVEAEAEIPIPDFAKASQAEIDGYFQKVNQRNAGIAAKRAAPSQHGSAVYMRSLFQEGDRVLVQLIHATETFIKHDGIYYTSRDGENYRSRDGKTLVVNKDAKGKCYVGAVGIEKNLVTPRASTEEYPRSLTAATSEAFIQILKEKNVDGWNIFVTMNPILEVATHRKESDIAVIRSAYAEVDENGPVCLTNVWAAVKAGEIPEPSVILQSSTNKYQFVWFTKDLTMPQQRALNKTLQMKFKTDEAAVDAARVLRLPGFYNMKTAYDPKPLVNVLFESTSAAAGMRYSLSDFKIDTTAATSSYPVGVEAAPETIKEICDEIEGGLKEADLNPVGKITTGQWKYKFTFECPHPDHTTTHTREVSVRSDGLIASHCYDTDCVGCGWTEWFRPWLEKAIARKLKFPKPEKAEPTGTKTFEEYGLTFRYAAVRLPAQTRLPNSV